MQFSYSKVFDLSQPVYNNCPHWETYAPVDVKLESNIPTHGFIAERFAMNAHSATHLDAPYHYIPTGTTIDKMPLDGFQGECLIVDCLNIEPGDAIKVEHFLPYDDKIKEGIIVLAVTGWGQKRNYTCEWYHEYPYVSKEAAEYLRDKKIKGFCIDTLSTGAYDQEPNGVPHGILLGADIWLLEDIIIPEELMEYERFHLFCFPLRLEGFGASPTRAVAFVE